MHVVLIRYCSALLMKRLKATQRRYARTPRRSAAPQALCSNEARGASIGAHAQIRERRGLSVCLLHHDHRDAGGERAAPRIPLQRRSRRRK